MEILQAKSIRALCQNNSKVRAEIITWQQIN